MKILVMSDSHGAKSAVVNAVKTESPDLIIHLGDGLGDLSAISQMFPQIPIHSAKGNCDYYCSSSETEGITLGEKKILMTHGHLFYVKSNLTNLIKYAKKQKTDIVLYGHTHIPHSEIIENMLVVNPGSIGYSVPKTYALIEIKNGTATCEHRSI